MSRNPDTKTWEKLTGRRANRRSPATHSGNKREGEIITGPTLTGRGGLGQAVGKDRRAWEEGKDWGKPWEKIGKHVNGKG